MQWGSIVLAAAPPTSSVFVMTAYLFADERLNRGSRGLRVTARWSALLISAVVIVTTSIARTHGAKHPPMLIPLGLTILLLLVVMFAVFAGMRRAVIISYPSLRWSEGEDDAEDNSALGTGVVSRAHRLEAMRDADRLIFVMTVFSLGLAAMYVAASIGA